MDSKFKKGDEVWFINHYFPSFPRRPFERYKVCKGILKEVIPNVKVIASDRKTILYTETHYIIKGKPDWIYAEIYKTKQDALNIFKQRNLKEYYK